MSYQLLLTTCPDEVSAETITRALLERRQAACVSRLPTVYSSYEWQGELCRSQEQLLLIKSRRERYHDVELTITELHPYELPEVIAVPIENGFPPYLSWIDKQTEKTL